LLTAAWQGQGAAVEALLEWHRKMELEEEGGGGGGGGGRRGGGRQELWLSSSSSSSVAPRHDHVQRRRRESTSSCSSFFFPSPSLLLSKTDARGRSAPYLSAAYGHNAVVSLLLAAGADPRSRSREGKTAMDKAVARGEKEVVGLLKRYEEEPGRVRVFCGVRGREGVVVGVGGKGEEKKVKEVVVVGKEEGEGRVYGGGWRRGWLRGWRQAALMEGGVEGGEEEEEDLGLEEGAAESTSVGLLLGEAGGVAEGEAEGLLEGDSDGLVGIVCPS